MATGVLMNTGTHTRARTCTHIETHAHSLSGRGEHHPTDRTETSLRSVVHTHVKIEKAGSEQTLNNQEFESELPPHPPYLARRAKSCACALALRFNYSCNMPRMSNEQHAGVCYRPHLFRRGGQKLEPLGQDKHSHPCQQTASYLSCGQLGLIKEKVRRSHVKSLVLNTI